MSIHSTEKYRVKNESIGGWNCKCYSNTSPSLTIYLSICLLSHPCSSVSSCRPNIVPTLVYKYSMIHYSMAHEPVGIVDSFLQDIKAVSFNWEWPCQLYMIQHTFKCYCYCTVMDCWFSCNSSFHHLLEHDWLLLVVSPRSFPLASIVQRYFLPLIDSLR